MLAADWDEVPGADADADAGIMAGIADEDDEP
jgi:hypothetical protein